jgi:hypothetical protein
MIITYKQVDGEPEDMQIYSKWISTDHGRVERYGGNHIFGAPRAH